MFTGMFTGRARATGRVRVRVRGRDGTRCDVRAVRLGQQRLTALTRVVAVLRLGGDILRGLALSRLAPRVDLDQGIGARGQVLDRARALRAPG